MRVMKQASSMQEWSARTVPNVAVIQDFVLDVINFEMLRKTYAQGCKSTLLLCAKHVLIKRISTGNVLCSDTVKKRCLANSILPNQSVATTPAACTCKDRDTLVRMRMA